MSARVKVVQDHVPEVLKSLKDLLASEVLVGIPDTTTERENESGSPITNAALGYIHENGAPEANIPARPWLVPGVQDAVKEFTPHLGAAAKAALDGDAGAADAELQAAGIVAASSAKRMIASNIPPPLKAATVRNRRYGRQTQSRRQAENDYLAMVKAGISPGDAQTAAGVRSLVNTGQLRNSVTSVVRKKD